MGAKVISSSVLQYPYLDPRLVTVLHPTGPAAEQYRLLHLRLDRLRAARPLAVVAFTSALAGEGKSTTVSNLAACAARRGRRTILVDCDLRRPGSSKLFGFDEVPPGLASILEQEVPVEQAIRQGPEGLSLIPAGRTADTPRTFWAARAFDSWWRRCGGPTRRSTWTYRRRSPSRTPTWPRRSPTEW